MGESSDLRKAVADTDARDGFRAQLVHTGNQLGVFLAFYEHGVMGTPPAWEIEDSSAIELYACRNPTEKDFGVASRIKLFAQAVAQFLNSGGSWEAMQVVLDYARDNAGGTVLSFEPLGYNLLSVTVNNEGDAEHIFTKPDDHRAIVWVEDSFIDVVSRTDLANQELDLDNADEEDSEAELQRGGDPEAEESDHQGGELPQLE